MSIFSKSNFLTVKFLIIFSAQSPLMRTRFFVIIFRYQLKIRLRLVLIIKAEFNFKKKVLFFFSIQITFL